MAVATNDLWVSREADDSRLWNLYRVETILANGMVLVDRLVSCGRPVVSMDHYTFHPDTFAARGFTRIRAGE